MADHHGKIVILTSGRQWCEFCREQMVAMRRLKEQLTGQRFEIVAVNYGSRPRRCAKLPVDPAQLRSA